MKVPSSYHPNAPGLPEESHLHCYGLPILHRPLPSPLTPPSSNVNRTREHHLPLSLQYNPHFQPPNPPHSPFTPECLHLHPPPPPTLIHGNAVTASLPRHSFNPSAFLHPIPLLSTNSDSLQKESSKRRSICIELRAASIRSCSEPFLGSSSLNVAVWSGRRLLAAGH